MTEVINLDEVRAARDAKPEPEQQDDEIPETHVTRVLEGAAKCLACEHEWVTTVDVGKSVFDLVCPKCDTRRGQLIYPIDYLPKDTLVWYCACGSTMFQLVSIDERGRLAKEISAENTKLAEETYVTASYCVGCGSVQEY